MTRRIKKDDRYNVASINKAIEIIGGAEKLARKIESSYQTVLNCVKIERATEGQVTRNDILPNYPWDDLK